MTEDIDARMRRIANPPRSDDLTLKRSYGGCFDSSGVDLGDVVNPFFGEARDQQAGLEQGSTDTATKAVDDIVDDMHRVGGEFHDRLQRGFERGSWNIIMPPLRPILVTQKRVGNRVLGDPLI